MKKHMKNQRGFTLIEIAIVLVIIGLLLGGVLKGQELINTARVRALNNTVDGITAAWFSFQDRYRAFPGDYLNAKSTVNLPGAPSGGDGGGLVGLDAVAAVDNTELANVWVHLEAAGYVVGGFDGVDTAIHKANFACAVTTCPDNGFGTGMVLAYGTLNQDGAVDAHELNSGRGIPVEVLAELDRKVDDGAATTGTMQVGNDGATGAAGWAGEAGCINGTAYQLQTPSSNWVAVFRNF